MDYNLKRNPDKTYGDIIEVRLKDITLNIYFKATAHISNRKEMAKLMEDLKQKGVTFEADWFY